MMAQTQTIYGTVERKSAEIFGQVYRATREGGTPYEGPYTVTPGDEAQELETAGKSLSRNVIVDKIPSNYGKIGWDGAKLTVS